MESKTDNLSTEITRQLIAEFIDNPVAVALAEDVILRDYAQNHVYEGRSEVEMLLRFFFSDGFPDSQTQVLSITAGETSAVLECAFHGRQDGPFLGIPATGRQVNLPMVIVCQISEGQIQRLGLYYDAGSLLRQLGLAL